MNLSYDKSSVLQGNKLRQENEEQPVTFAGYNGATEGLPSASLDTKNQRMAGPVGARAMQLMTDPQARAATERWEGLFGQSNPRWVTLTEKNSGKHPKEICILLLTIN